MGRIVVAFEGQNTLMKMCEIVDAGGFQADIACSTGAEVLRYAAKYEIDLILCGFKLRDMVGEELFSDLPNGTDMLMIAPQGELDCLENGQIRGLAAPVRRSALLEQLTNILDEHAAKEKMAAKNRSLADKQVIQDAKQHLMTQHNMTEETAYRFIQKHSMNTGTKMVDMAKRILENAESVLREAGITGNNV